jgi:hypothetical protein
MSVPKLDIDSVIVIKTKTSNVELNRKKSYANNNLLLVHMDSCFSELSV